MLQASKAPLAPTYGEPPPLTAPDLIISYVV